jgi:hypothetical protein
MNSMLEFIAGAIVQAGDNVQHETTANPYELGFGSGFGLGLGLGLGQPAR